MTTTAVQEVEVWVCPGCDHVFDEEPELTTLYECGNCGTTFSKEDEGSNRCPDCGKFAAKQDDGGCPECGEAWEGLEAVTRYQHEGCDEYHESAEEARACATGEDYTPPAKQPKAAPFQVGDKVMALGGIFFLHYSAHEGCKGPATITGFVANGPRRGQFDGRCDVHDLDIFVRPGEVLKVHPEGRPFHYYEKGYVNPEEVKKL